VASLYDEVVPLLGERRAMVFCHAISAQNDCLICSTFFRRLLADGGEDPDDLALPRSPSRARPPRR
jgi:hypothetical protein